MFVPIKRNEKPKKCSTCQYRQVDDKDNKKSCSITFRDISKVKENAKDTYCPFTTRS